SKLDRYLSYLVQSPYLLTLDNAGYGVHRGSFNAGAVDSINLTPNGTIPDSQLQHALQAVIGTGALQAPDSNRLYVVFVQDNVAVQRSYRSTSPANFQGSPSAFLDTDPYLGYHDIHYVVVPYPRGSVGNAAAPWLSDLGNMTLITARELANAVTDPDLHYKAPGFLDDGLVNLDGTKG